MHENLSRRAIRITKWKIASNRKQSQAIAKHPPIAHLLSQLAPLSDTRLRATRWCRRPADCWSDSMLEVAYWTICCYRSSDSWRARETNWMTGHCCSTASGTARSPWTSWPGRSSRSWCWSPPRWRSSRSEIHRSLGRSASIFAASHSSSLRIRCGASKAIRWRFEKLCRA